MVSTIYSLGGEGLNFFINKKDMISLLSDFTIILKDNSVRPVLSGIFIEAKDNKLTFVATNLENDLIKVVETKVIKGGTVVIKPTLILEYIKLLDVEEIEFRLEGDILYIHSAEFLVLSGENYPVLGKHTGEKVTTFSATSLKNNVEKVKFAASTNTDNIAISVVRLNIKKEYIDYVATDSFRLICYTDKCDNILEKAISLPLESMSALQKLLPEGEEKNINLSLYENHAIFTWDGTYFSTRLIELSYPDYEAILKNSSYSKIMEFNNNQLKSSLKKVISISKTSSEVKFGAIFEFKNKKVEIKTSSGKAKLTEKLDMIKEGEDFTSSLNSKFILDFVSMVNKNIVIKGNNSQSMFEINEYGTENYRYILMPLAMRS